MDAEKRTTRRMGNAGDGNDDPSEGDCAILGDGLDFGNGILLPLREASLVK